MVFDLGLVEGHLEDNEQELLKDTLLLALFKLVLDSYKLVVAVVAVIHYLSCFLKGLITDLFEVIESN